MTTDISFTEPTTATHRYPLHKRQPLKDDIDRLTELARELNLDSRDLVLLAAEDIVRYREQTLILRRLLADVLQVQGIDWNPDAPMGSGRAAVSF